MPLKRFYQLKVWQLVAIFLMLTPCFYSLAFNTQAQPPSPLSFVDISEIFPSATRIGPVDKKIAVTPVYQLNDLLGYVFESDDFTNFIGFSGQTINILIGIDTQGVVAGLKILNHHEPIFLHGLGESPLLEFVKQYQHHSIKERFIINARNKSSKDATYFDGITRATISVLVVNDTIITSALKVAREKLSGFVAPSNVVINSDFNEPLNFEQLIERKYIQHWQVTREQAQALTENTSQTLTKVINALSNETNNFIDLYFAFVNIPIIGKNLLGETEYQRLLENLIEGEHALMIVNRGNYKFVSENFIPQTVPSRLSLTQESLPVDIRDVDFYSYFNPRFALKVPDYNEIKVFRIKSQSGFELHKSLSLSLAVNYNQSFLSQNQHNFTFESILPKTLFIDQTPLITKEKPKPLWLKIWIERRNEIIILCLYLLALTIFFIKQNTLVKNEKLTHQVRFIALIFVIAFIGFYTQGQLSVVNIYTLLLSLAQGFKIEVFLLDPIIFILWIFVFITLFLWGRGLFCGWLCPFGALQELMTLIATKLKIKQIKIKPKQHKMAQKIKYLILVLLVSCAFYSLTLAEQLAEVEPFKTSLTLNFVRYWPFVLYAVLLLLLSLKIHKFYCRYLCPLGAGLAVIGRYPIFKWLRRRDECGTPCQLCRSKKCGIDAIKPSGAIDYSECIQCLECVVVINSPTLCVVNKYANKTKPSPIKLLNCNT